MRTYDAKVMRNDDAQCNTGESPLLEEYKTASSLSSRHPDPFCELFGKKPTSIVILVLQNLNVLRNTDKLCRDILRLISVSN